MIDLEDPEYDVQAMFNKFIKFRTYSLTVLGTREYVRFTTGDVYRYARGSRDEITIKLIKTWLMCGLIVSDCDEEENGDYSNNRHLIVRDMYDHWRTTQERRYYEK